jgi:cellulose synthase (UDP-forming)
VKKSPLWREFESGDGFLLRAVRFCVLISGILFFVFSATLELPWEQQVFLGGILLLAALWINRASPSQLTTLVLILLSVYSTIRYGYWRVTTVIAFFRDPGSHWTGVDIAFVGLLLSAEFYAFTVLVLGYLQVLWPLHRSPVPLPDDPHDWPAVDLLIPTIDEPLSLVRFTALAAMNIDWPAEKLHVYILDDGSRAEFRDFAEEAGVGYIARKDHKNAKAGNINHALAQLESPFIAVFDCDHVPTRSFLQLTMGWLLRDDKLGVLQTPHHFYSPDPYARNLNLFRAVPGEDELFYGVVQDGNDFWNATCFCGSCAILRRSALDEVGGMATETVTEDAHTSLRMQMGGWNTAYINIPQAAGLATDRLSAHIRQRIRWARGMVQILRLQNPLFARGLTAAQRLCYFNAMSHFLFPLPRLIFLTAPLIYLIFGMTSIPGYWAAILAYALPHLAISAITRSRIQGEYRHSFWNEIYETVLAPYLFLPTLFAILKPKAGKFNVTPKAGILSRGYFDGGIARPFLLLLLLNFFGLFCAVARSVQFPLFSVPPWLSFLNWPAHLFSRAPLGIIWVNAAWSLFNIVILGVVVGVAWESQQRRQSTRVTMSVPADVILPDDSMIQGVTSDLSSGGVRTRVDGIAGIKIGDCVRFVFPLLDGTATLPATVIGMDGAELRAEFSQLTLQEDEALTMLLYSRADAWLGHRKRHRRDRPLHSMARILGLSLRGLAMTVGLVKPAKSSKIGLASTTLPVVLVAMLVGLAGKAQTPAATTPLNVVTAQHTRMVPTPESDQNQPGSFDETFTLADVGLAGPVLLRGTGASRSIAFSVPRNQLVRSATLELRYSISAASAPDASQLNLSLNGTLFATLPFTAANPGSQAVTQQTTLSLPVELLVHSNQLSFDFVGRNGAPCNPSNSKLDSRVDPGSTIELRGVDIPLANDLRVLPLPFFEAGTILRPKIQIAFLAPPSFKALQAAGIIASWFGELSGNERPEFSVSVGSVPNGNAIVIDEGAPAARSSAGFPSPDGSMVAMRANPADASSKLLVVAGEDPEQLLTAAKGLVLHGLTWQGAQVSIRDLSLPEQRKVGDAPRWLSTQSSRTANVGEILQAANPTADIAGLLQTDGSTPVTIPLDLPPDLDFGDRKNLAFHLIYRYNGVPLGDGSTLQVYVNGAYVSSTPMPHTANASAALETIVPIPVSDLHPSANSLTFKFAFLPAVVPSCATASQPNLSGAILKDSYLDISGIGHSATLPNLGLFWNSGFPFTRSADLSTTTIVLPQNPSVAELELYLSLMERFGAQTGYPALDVSVIDPHEMNPNTQTNYVVLGTVADQTALSSLSAVLPVVLTAGDLRIRSASRTDKVADWLPWRSATQKGSDGMTVETTVPDAIAEEVEWPSNSSRTALILLARDNAAVPLFIRSFSNPQPLGDRSSVMVLRGMIFSPIPADAVPYKVADEMPFVGTVKAIKQFPWLVAGLTLMFCFLLAVLLQAMLRRHARSRLQGAN